MSRWTLPVILVVLFESATSEILTPPYFNLAEGKEIIASATCGVDTPGPELYCKLVGANADPDENINLIQGQVCDYCDPEVPEKRHPPEYVSDGTEKWWQSPPLSRGMKYNEVNLTINLGQPFHVAYVYVRMGNSPRPGLWVLEKSSDYGKSWSPWQYFSDSASDCLSYFGVHSQQTITRDDSVICTTDYSTIVPLEGGEMAISILNNRPSAKHYFNSTLLQEWTRATNVRFRFLRTKNLLGHLMSVARQDITVTRRYYYSISEISIGGRCMCNGHADTCDIQDPNQPKKLVCRCQHNTCGPQCETCCKGFKQKKWRISTAFKKFTCEPCNCFGHSDECMYDPEIDEKSLSLDIHGNYEGGGICQNCRDNTEGINCNRCIAKFYRPSLKQWNDTDVCQPCNCDFFYSTGNCAEATGKCECRPEFTPPNCDSCNYGYFGYPNCRPCECNLKGTKGYHCEATAGYCPCKDNYSGRYCNECAVGYFNFPECVPCACNELGSLNDKCEVVFGNCTCKNNYGGRTCDMCEDGYYDYPSCTYCNCDTRGTEPGVCEKTEGKCLCKEGYGGSRCDQCLAGYYGYPNCRPCNCSTVGSSSIGCDATGKCSCLANFAGKTCDQCSPGYYMYPECTGCNCDNHGSIGVSCDLEGNCQCRENFDGNRCDRCKEGFYNFPNCEGCNCDPAGVVETFLGCGTLPPGELCKCKERVEGRICNTCKPLYWNLQPFNPLGCQECKCNISGVIGGIGECDSKSGQCICKPSVTDTTCSQCVDGTYRLEESNLFGCSECNCDIGGSIDQKCNKDTGQCRCQARVFGTNCKEPIASHYFPTLHQFQYEAENGRTIENNPVRYGFAQDLFPGYSWKGYAVFSPLQNKIFLDVDINKPSLYRMILRYVNPNPESVLGSISITPDNPNEIEQRFQVVLKPTTTPSFVTVAGAQGNFPSAMVMNPGHWTIGIDTKKSLFLDYIVLMPQEYYEATILTQGVNVPCEIGFLGLCRHYAYPTLSMFDSVLGTGGYMNRNDGRAPLIEYLTDTEALQTVGETDLPIISSIGDDTQNVIHFDLRVVKPGLHVLVLTYMSDQAQKNHSSSIMVEANGDGKGSATLHPCRYTSLCRQVVTDATRRVAVFNLTSNYIGVTLTAEGNSRAAIKSIVAIPQGVWSMNYLKPRSVCVRSNGKCVQGFFASASDAKRIDFETVNEDWESSSLIPEEIFDKTSKFIKLNEDSSSIDIPAKVPQPGEYVFVVQYYQPDYPDYEIDVLVQNGKFYEGKVTVGHCPSITGCRSIVRQNDGGSTMFQLIENFVLTLKESGGRNVWLDHLLVIPAELYNDKILEKLQIDQTKDFIKHCSGNHFYISMNETGFCRDSVFSITINYNNKALPCHCDIDGTIKFECDKFGGQCSCKPNIIGRRCEICKTGFYGFPNCRPCKCPSTAICEPETGECICPPRVTGELCDQCENETYGFDPIIGCEKCNCSPLGVVNGNVQCDLVDGTCECKENVVGRQCDRCAPGFSHFPHCKRCDCDLRGTTEEICDQYTAECHCKSNVQDSACDVCREGTFNLQTYNEEGCSKCFCFGKTTRCTSAKLYRTHIIDMTEWGAELINDKTGETGLSADFPRAANESTIIIDLNKGENFDSGNVTYFSAPATYLNKKLTSYGGTLNYTIHYMTELFGEAARSADVILKGEDNLLLIYYGEEEPPQHENFEASVELVEKNFLTINRAVATREQMMVVLSNLKGLYIRATYWSPTVAAMLSYVTMEEATITVTRDRVQAGSVEHCQCPPNYQGYSCEQCAPGHYRVQTGPYGGYCLQCQCNGHSNECDVDTGICYNCQNYTTGDHCEKCEIGYHGNATIGNQDDCLICACPHPEPSNNFATSCEVSDDGTKISCDCLEGYYGARCESCAAGFYGQPEVLGDFCKICECSGNIDTNEIGSCDSINGECLHCLNNTYGEACNLCAPGYFGDAIERKDCQSCLCDSCGMEKCDSYNGICECRLNVVGEKCDRCADNHYGFKACKGCKACDCALASESSQCDDETGQCRCKPGVTGRNCDRCIAGFWNYSEEGCTSCGCNTGYSVGTSCDPKTGQCTCLPGVVGEKCEHCPHRYVLIEGEGCERCDSCIHDLLNVTDHLQGSLDPVFNEYNTVADTYFTNQRLKFINDTVEKYYPQVKLLDPYRANILSPSSLKIDGLEKQMDTQKRESEDMDEDSIAWKDAAEKSLEDVNALQKDYVREKDYINSVVLKVISLSNSIEMGSGAEQDKALKQAEKAFREIDNVRFSAPRDDANDEWGEVNELTTEIQKYSFPVNNLSLSVGALDHRVDNFSLRIDDVYNITEKAQELSDLVERLNRENENSAKTGNLERMKNGTEELEQDLKAGQELNEKAKRAISESENNLMMLHNKVEPDLTDQLKDSMMQYDKLLAERLDNVTGAATHADKLHNRSWALDGLLTDTRNMSAVKAVQAYEDIVKAIASAQESADEASQAARNASQLLREIDNNPLNLREVSTKLLKEAIVALNKTDGKLQRDLERARNLVSKLNDETQLNQDKLNYIEKSLGTISQEPPALILQKAMNDADKVQFKMEQIRHDAKDVIEDTPSNVLTQVKQLSRDAGNSIRDIFQANKQLDSLSRVLPNITSLLNALDSRKNAINATGNQLYNKIESIKQKIINARELASRFDRVALRFYRNTTLELKNPETLRLLQRSTKISLYFNTTQTNGFLLYLGNEDNKKAWKQSSDFMALLIESGRPVLIMDLGSGPEKIINPYVVSDGVWRQIIIDRTGKNVKLIVREQVNQNTDKLHSKEHTLSGPYTIFEVDEKDSKLFVGGYPSSFQMQSNVTAFSFEGNIEELMIGDTHVSLFNFVDGDNNDHPTWERDRLVNSKTSMGMRFDRGGYAVLNKTQEDLGLYGEAFEMRLNIKTLEKDGLIFFMKGDNNKFISLEMRNGFVVYKLSMGDADVTWQSAETYNDGVWHIVEIRRYKTNGTLIIDGKLVVAGQVESFEKEMMPIDDFYFGSVPSDVAFHYPLVSTVGFDGCIDDVKINTRPMDLNNNIKAFGVKPGCPTKFISLVTFEEEKPGYIKLPIASVSNSLEMSLTFKTTKPRGILFHVTNPDNTESSTLSLVDGLLVFESRGEKLHTGTAGVVFNDDKLHSVTAMHTDKALRLIIDDELDGYATDSPPPPLYILHGSLYIGGIPPRRRTGVSDAFAGCIDDVTLNNVAVNLAESTERPNAIFGSCRGRRLEYPELERENEEIPWNVPLPTEKVEDITLAVTQSNIVVVKPIMSNVEERERPIEGRPHSPDNPDDNSMSTNDTEEEQVPTPKTVDSCRLPYYPAPDLDAGSTYRLGVMANSRLEYNVTTQNRDNYDFQIDVKTMSEEGIIFYSSEGSSFHAIYVKEGRAHLMFTCLNEPVSLDSDLRINDNQWHSIAVRRELNYGEMIVDDQNPINIYCSESESAFQVSAPYYVGGITQSQSDSVYQRIGTSSSFAGCLGGFAVNGQPVGEPSQKFRVIPCSKRVEPGLFLYPGNGSNYYKAMDSLVVGRTLEIVMDIKPRSSSGHLFSVHAKNSYVMLELINGTVRFFVKTTKGDDIYTTYEPPKPNMLCDGNWHNIRAVKDKKTLELSVDHKKAPRKMASRNAPLRTENPVYIGGHEKVLNVVRGSKSRTQYVGCINNLSIDGKLINFDPKSAYGDAFVGICPTI